MRIKNVAGPADQNSLELLENKCSFAIIEFLIVPHIISHIAGPVGQNSLELPENKCWFQL